MFGICDECEQDIPREQHLTSCLYHPENFSEGEPEPEADPVDYGVVYLHPDEACSECHNIPEVEGHEYDCPWRHKPWG